MEYEDTIAIETPEGVDLELTLAGLGSRFAAAWIDITIQLLLVGAAAVSLLVFDPAGLGLAVFLVCVFVIFFFYDILFEVLASGRTPGKRWTGIRVVRAGGEPVTFLASAVRNLFRLVDLLPAAYVAGAVAILATPRNQRLGDLAAGTVVVRERRGVPLTAWRAPPAPPPAETASWDVSAIRPAELAAVRSFLERRDELVADARQELARTLALRLRPLVVGAAGVPDDERFLEGLAAAKSART